MLTTTPSLVHDLYNLNEIKQTKKKQKKEEIAPSKPVEMTKAVSCDNERMDGDADVNRSISDSSMKAQTSILISNYPSPRDLCCRVGKEKGKSGRSAKGVFLTACMLLFKTTLPHSIVISRSQKILMSYIETSAFYSI